jgi:uncharacterized protein (TIGR03083 family)
VLQRLRYLECLAADAGRLRSAASLDLTNQVPTCPDWSVEDLVQHTAVVYLHKAECMRLNAFPDTWPPDVSGEEPLALFDRAYDDLVAEFEARDPSEKTVTWYEPDQTVGFWVRRMAQESVIHRVDAELAVSEPLRPIPSDLAVDGVDELLMCFLEYATKNWPDEFPQLANCDGSAVRVLAGERSWSVRLEPGGVVVSESDDTAAATVSGDPDAVLLWLWRRAGDQTVHVEGDHDLIGTLRDLLGVATL